MAYFVHNIGKPAANAWWHQLLHRGVITTGFQGEPGDKGATTLERLQEGDWVIAWANEAGYVGAGQVQAPHTYRYHATPPPDSLSDHQHERAVTWSVALPRLSKAVNETEAGRRHPRNTLEAIHDSAVGERLIQTLRDRGAQDLSSGLHVSGPQVFWLAGDAVLTLYARRSHPVTVNEAKAYIEHHVEGYNTSNTNPDLCLLSVNDRSRGHYARKRVGVMLRSDQGYAHDQLYKSQVDGEPRYEPYRPAEHGVWRLEPDRKGVPRLIEPGHAVSLVHAAMHAAQEELDATVSAEGVLSSEQQARELELRAVARRRGQSKFRHQLLAAYGHRCAMTGCQVVDLLEAAHILPHRLVGEEGHQVNNGLPLRADLHTLFDLGHVWVDDAGRIQLSSALDGSEYAALRNKVLIKPDKLELAPHPKHLAHHRVHVARQPE